MRTEIPCQHTHVRSLVVSWREWQHRVSHRLSNNRVLTDLSLQHCNLVDALPALCVGLARNRTLKRLEVGTNNFSNSDLLQLCDGLRPMTQLEYLGLSCVFLFLFFVLRRVVCFSSNWHVACVAITPTRPGLSANY
jgi:hypothetical protein